MGFKQLNVQRSMIDLVLASRKTIVHDIKAIPTMSLDSDHRLVVAETNINTRPSNGNFKHAV